MLICQGEETSASVTRLRVVSNFGDARNFGRTRVCFSPAPQSPSPERLTAVYSVTGAALFLGNDLTLLEIHV